VIEAAVGDEAGSVPMIPSGPWSMVSAAGSQQCRLIRLDDWATDAVDYIKIDTEGYEPNVLAGARRLVVERRPIMVMEFGAWTLLGHGYDPMVFADAVVACFEVLGFYHAETVSPTPTTGHNLAFANLVQHSSVSDLLLRPRGVAIPSLVEMTLAPTHRATLNGLSQQVDALKASTSWRVTAPLRALGDSAECEDCAVAISAPG
jgi:hypothetical protein